MEGNIKVKVHDCHSSGRFYSDDPPSKDAQIHTRFGNRKTQSYAAKTRENPN